MLFFIKKRDFVMKKIKALSLLMLFASAQIDSVAATNPELAFVLSYQALDNFARTVSSDRDDIGALQLLDFMNKSISFDAQQKQQIAAAQDGYLSKGTPLDPAKIAAQNKELQARIETLNHNIKAFEKGGVTAVEKARVDRRRSERRQKMAAISQNQAALDAQNAAKADVDKKTQAAQALIDQNELAFEQALESYIESFGQVYVNKGSIVISSKYNKEMPITPKEYAQLVATLKNASSQFGSAVSINLNLDSSAPASIKDVVGYVGNMAPAGASYLSYAGYALAATAVAAAAIAAVSIGSKMYYDDKGFMDAAQSTGQDASVLFNSGVVKAQDAGKAFATSASSFADQAGLNAAADRFSSWINSVAQSDSVQYLQHQYNQLRGKPADVQAAANDIINQAPENIAEVVAAIGEAAPNSQDAQVAAEIINKIELSEQNGTDIVLDTQESNWLMKGAAGLGAAATAVAAAKIPAVRNAIRNAQFMPQSASQSMQTLQATQTAQAATQASITQRQAQQLAAMSPRKYAQIAAGKASAPIDYTAANAKLERALQNTMNPNTGMSAAQAAQQASNQAAVLSGANFAVVGGVAAGANAFNS